MMSEKMDGDKVLQGYLTVENIESSQIGISPTQHPLSPASPEDVQ